MMYDYVIVGAGLFGSVFANEMWKKGKKCLVVEKAKHLGGNCYTENRDNINIHMYGPHIFHTNDDDIWNYVTKLTPFHQYKQSTKARIGNKFYSFPINLLTLQQIWEDVVTPEQAAAKLKEVSIAIEAPKNLEEWAHSQIGTELYDLFVKGYTTKQWGKDPKDLPRSIIKRLPIRSSFDDNYYFDKYQGIPVGGYTQIFHKLLAMAEVRTNVDFFLDRDELTVLAPKMVFTGRIDEFFDYKFGVLDYRSLDFQHERHEKEDYQGCSIVTYPQAEVPWTRVTEHKHFEKSKSPVTWISREYPKEYSKGDVPYYPINDEKNNRIFKYYEELATDYPNVIFGGRLAEYKYYDMHQVIGSALTKARRE